MLLLLENNKRGSKAWRDTTKSYKNFYYAFTFLLPQCLGLVKKLFISFLPLDGTNVALCDSFQIAEAES